MTRAVYDYWIYTKPVPVRPLKWSFSPWNPRIITLSLLLLSTESAIILECVTNSKATALYHSLAIVPLTNQKPRLLVDGIQTLSWDRPSLPAGGFSPLSPPPSPRSLCQLSTRPRPGRANSRWRPNYEFRFFSTIQPPACRLEGNLTLFSRSFVSKQLRWMYSLQSLICQQCQLM